MRWGDELGSRSHLASIRLLSLRSDLDRDGLEGSGVTRTVCGVCGLIIQPKFGAGAGYDHQLDTLAVNIQSAELMNEFADHWSQLALVSRRPVTRSEAFEGWALQKIAGLQLAVLATANKRTAA